MHRPLPADKEIVMKKFLGLATAVVGAALASSAWAQSAFPGKPVTLVVPFTAGGPTDLVGRGVAQGMTKALGQSVVVENTAGAGGTIAANRVKNAPADGYTLLVHHIGMSTAPALYRKLAFNPTTDFEPVAMVIDTPMTLIARPDFPAKDVGELIAYVKANKAKLNLANAGIGSASHLCGLLFQNALQTDVTTVPFKGTADALNALIGKQVDLLCDQSTNTTQHINAGTVKAYGVTSKTRLPTLPNLPTLDEAGLKGFQVGVWNGVYAPKGTPKPVIDKLAAAVQQALKDPDFRKRMADLGSTVFAQEQSTPAALAAQLKSEIARWTPVIQAAGIYAD
jgi:tripartite-type tricarboxylate transporter receptor subunit TctC